MSHAADPVAVPPKTVAVSVSARHVHLSRADCDRLFGTGYELVPDRPISQPGQWAAVEKLNLVGPRGRIDGVRIIGPLRKESQVEIARTDEIKLGLDAPIRLSGELAGTPGLVLEGPRGPVPIDHGVIQAQRHIHASPAEAEALGVADREEVQVRVTDPDGERSLVFDDVIVRVSPDYALEMHVDTDEGNACDWQPGFRGHVIRKGFASHR
ncbi:MAG TPA: phosphate propanoyltransferase [Myxococcota bacterium]|jgi:propanediol utilization protein|nr:phosphate propanoyltransferase [Myxococcota bacterium]